MSEKSPTSFEKIIKIALIDDYDEIRDLVTFMIEAHLTAEVHSFSTGNQAIKAFKEKTFDFDLVISDQNMPDGSGATVYLNLRQNYNEVPFIFLTTDVPEKLPELKGKILTNYFHVSKPFSDLDLIGVIKKALKLDEAQETFIPIHLGLLRKIDVIHAPLYVKINELKFVKVANENSQFGETEYAKYLAKGLTHLYTEGSYLDQFIKEFRKESLSEDAFNNASLKESAEKVSINVDLMKSIADRFGWTKDVIELAEDNLKRGLALAKTHQDLQRVFQQFYKIERLGFADHCTLLVLLTTGLAKKLGISSPKAFQQLTFAALFHDACLTESQYEEKRKLLKMIERKENLHNKDVKAIITHTAKAADLVRSWDFCPSGAAEIIFCHHENSLGTGFPMGRKASEIDELSALFIIAEDLVLHIFDTLGSPDLPSFTQSRSSLYKIDPFLRPFNILKGSIQIS